MTWKGGVWSESEIKKRTIQIFITSYFFFSLAITLYTISTSYMCAYQPITASFKNHPLSHSLTHTLPFFFPMVMKTNEKWKNKQERTAMEKFCVCHVWNFTHLFSILFSRHLVWFLLVWESRIVVFENLGNNKWFLNGTTEEKKYLNFFYSMSRFVLVYKCDFIFWKMWLDRKRSWLSNIYLEAWKDAKGTWMQFTMSQKSQMNRALARDEMVVTFKAFTNHDYNFHEEKSVRLVVSFERDFNFFSLPFFSPSLIIRFCVGLRS